MRSSDGRFVTNGSTTGQYQQAHLRVRNERGDARQHACVDCGGEANEWAFDEPVGWSNDVTRYRPLCYSCHGRADRGYKHTDTAREKIAKANRGRVVSAATRQKIAETERATKRKVHT